MSLFAKLLNAEAINVMAAERTEKSSKVLKLTLSDGRRPYASIKTLDDKALFTELTATAKSKAVATMSPLVNVVTIDGELWCVDSRNSK